MKPALAQLHLPEAFVAASLDAIRKHGGQGYLSEAGSERDRRDVVGGVVSYCASGIRFQVIAGSLKA